MTYHKDSTESGGRQAAAKQSREENDMSDLQIFERNKRAVVSSRTIAERFGKVHRDTLRAIDNLIVQNCAVKMMFTASSYTSRGRKYTEYLMNRDGFSLLVMGFTGKDALEWKLKYIAAFNQMEALLLQKQTADWQQTRLLGIITSEMGRDAYYKEIYQTAKRQLLEIKRLWATPRLTA